MSQWHADNIDTDDGDGFAMLDDGESEDDGEEAENFLDHLDEDERRHFFENLQEGDVVFLGEGEDDRDSSDDDDEDD